MSFIIIFQEITLNYVTTQFSMKMKILRMKRKENEKKDVGPFPQSLLEYIYNVFITNFSRNNIKLCLQLNFLRKRKV